MDISTVISVGLGLIFLFLVVSVITSAITEAISTIFRTRSKHLKRAIAGMLGGAEAEKLYGTKIIESLKNTRALGFGQRATSDPSYIERRDFTNALLAVLDIGKDIERVRIDANPTAGQPASTPLGQMNEVVGKLPSGSVKKYLEELISAGTASVKGIEDDLARWFDAVMDRVSGWYKRWVNVVIFLAGLALAAGLNINTVVVADSLWSDPVFRRSVESAISELLASSPGPQDTPTPEEVLAEIETLNAMNIPIGWTSESEDPRHFGGWSVPGWILTALAATAGAPFWFDLLKMVANVRGSGPPSGKESKPNSQVDS